MSETSSPRSENPSDPLDALHRAVRAAAEPGRPGEAVTAAIGRASRQLGLSYARTKAHWYREARSVPAAEWIAVQTAREILLRAERMRLETRLAQLSAELKDISPDAPELPRPAAHAGAADPGQHALGGASRAA